MADNHQSIRPAAVVERDAAGGKGFLGPIAVISTLDPPQNPNLDTNEKIKAVRKTLQMLEEQNPALPENIVEKLAA